MSNTYSAIIIDDDVEALKVLGIYINKYCLNIDQVHEATDIKMALLKIQEHDPDIIFLDVLLGNDTAFNLLDNIDRANAEVIFVSSFKEFAFKAIKYEASYYLEKPVNIDDFMQSVKRAVHRIEEKRHAKAHKNTSILLEYGIKERQESVLTNQMIAVSSSSKVDIIKVNDIVYCEAEKGYTIFHLLDGTSKVSSKNLLEYERLLIVRGNFFRIHHKYLINLNMVEGIKKADGNYCEMHNKKLLPISKRKRDGLFKFLGI